MAFAVQHASHPALSIHIPSATYVTHDDNPNRYNTFASGGCDGGVYMWDWQNKKRLSVLGQYTTRFVRCT